MARLLAILEHGHRGGAETQFADALYLVRELNRQLGGLDLALRGPAVTFALGSAVTPAVKVAARPLQTLPEPGRSLRALLADGVQILVDADDLAALGLGRDRLLAGIEPVAAGALALRWPDYDGVWFP